MTSSTPGGRPTIVTSMRRGSGNLKVIAFVLVPDASSGAALVRTGDATNRADTDIRDTALASLEPGRVLLADQLDPLLDGALELTTYAVTDAAITPAPASILELRFDNLGPPVSANTSWAKSDGTYPFDQPFEWAQVAVPAEEYDDATLMGASGWVVAPGDSGADVPFSHPFGFDWEFGIVLDEPSKGLLSPANAEAEEGAEDANHNSIALAEQLGLIAPEGLLGLEWDKGLLPQSYRGQVNHGDRVACLVAGSSTTGTKSPPDTTGRRFIPRCCWHQPVCNSRHPVYQGAVHVSPVSEWPDLFDRSDKSIQGRGRRRWIAEGPHPRSGREGPDLPFDDGGDLPEDQGKAVSSITRARFVVRPPSRARRRRSS